jgi:autotransporter-associated beta strand protein
MTHTRVSVHTAAAAVILLAAAATARGQTTYAWTNAGTAWNDPAAWATLSGPGTQYPGFAADDIAEFVPQVGGLTATNPVVGGAFGFQQLVVGNTPALGTTTFTGSGTITLSTAAPLGGLTVRGLGTTTFAGPSIAGAGASNFAVLAVGHGAGLTLTGSSVANANIGSAAVQGGTLTVDNAGTNTLNRLSLGGNNLYLLDGGTLDYRANPAGGTAALSTSTTGLNFTSGDTTVRITLAAAPTGQTVLQFGGYTRGLMTGSTVNFVLAAPAGVTLGGAGATDPRVTFTSNSNLTDGQLLLANSFGGAGGNARGLAFVNGTDFAAWNSARQTVVAVAATPKSSSTLSGTGTTGNVVFTPDAAGGTTTLTAGTNTATSSIKLDVPAGQTTLDLGSFTLNTIGLLLPGPNDYAITGGSAARLFGGTGGTGNKIVYVTQPTTTLSVGVSMSFNFPVTKSGPGTLALTGTTDQLSLSTTDPTRAVYLNGGVLRAAPGVNFGTNNVLEFRGGVLEITNGGTYTRPVGTAVGAVNWNLTTNTFDAGSGGFSAVTQDVTINLGGTGTTLTWGDSTGSFVQDGSALLFGSPTSSRTVTWQNPLALDAGTPGVYAAREIGVTRGTGTAADRTSLTGLVTGSSSTDLMKSGTGVLELARPGGNTYAGNTLVFAGTLLASNTTAGTSATGTGAVTVGSGGTLAGTGFVAPQGGKRVTVLAGGTLAPGNPTGLLTVTAPVNLAAGATLAWTLADPTPSSAAANSGTSSPAGLRSQLAVGGAGNTVTAGGLTFRITETTTPTFVPGQTYSWLVADTGATPTLGAVTFDLSAAPDFARYGGASALSLQPSGTAVYLNFTPVPEPQAVLVVAAVVTVAMVIVGRR